MNEIYINTSRYAYFDVYGATAASTPTAEIQLPGATATALVVTQVSGVIPDTATERWQAYVPMEFTAAETEFTVEWSATLGAEAATKTDYFTVVTPYVTPEEIVARYGWSLSQNSEKYIARDTLEQIERVVRGVITAYAGVEFGSRTSVVTAYGSNTDVLSVGEYIGSISSLTENGVVVWAADGSVNDFGYDLAISETKQAIKIVNAGFDIEESEPGAFMPAGKFRDGYRYDVAGVFGFNSVPAPVKEAALILVKDYMGKDASYRAKYMTDVAVRDWTFKFESQAFNGTGNVVADQLLSPWVAPWIAVI